MAERAESHSETEVQNLRERMAKTEWKVEAVDNRLSQGAESFSDLRNSIGAVRQDLKEAHERFTEAVAPKPTPIWKILGLAFSALCVATTVVWMLARYPDRSEFTEAQKLNNAAHEDLEDDMDQVRNAQQDLATDQRLIKASQANADKSLGKIDGKLDKLLEPAPRSR
jgi:predicted  nucleic acid-binding Zn-ribbon protein